MLLASVITSALISVSAPAETNASPFVMSDTIGYYVLDDSRTDGKRRVALIDVSEYTILTGRLDKVWSLYHSNIESRKRLHGKLLNTIVDEKALIIQEIYSDGYTHTERMKKILPKVKKSRLINGIRHPPIRVKPNSMSARQWKKKIESESKTNKVVTVEFGPGGKPIKEVK